MAKAKKPPLTFPARIKDTDDLIQRALAYFKREEHARSGSVGITAGHIARLIQRYQREKQASTPQGD